MFCIQDDMCYNKGEEVVPAPDIRERLKAEILSLDNEQVEYVLRRLLCYLQKENSNG